MVTLTILLQLVKFVFLYKLPVECPEQYDLSNWMILLEYFRLRWNWVCVEYAYIYGKMYWCKIGDGLGRESLTMRMKQLLDTAAVALPR